jgi:predicted transcriptional regulator
VALEEGGSVLKEQDGKRCPPTVDGSQLVVDSHFSDMAGL